MVKPTAGEAPVAEGEAGVPAATGPGEGVTAHEGPAGAAAGGTGPVTAHPGASSKEFSLQASLSGPRRCLLFLVASLFIMDWRYVRALPQAV